MACVLSILRYAKFLRPNAAITSKKLAFLVDFWVLLEGRRWVDEL